jgi:hypothetical protein
MLQLKFSQSKNGKTNSSFQNRRHLGEPPRHSETQTSDFQTKPEKKSEPSVNPNEPVSDREKNIAFGLGLLVCVVGVILTPILIGIPIICVGLWMVFFTNSFVRYSRKK